MEKVSGGFFRSRTPFPFTPCSPVPTPRYRICASGASSSWRVRPSRHP